MQWARDVMERQVQQLTRLVDDLLDVSRISRGKIRLRQERVDVAALVHQAVETSRPVIEERQHDLTVSLPAEPLQVMADPARLEQILVNLLNNAAKYTQRGGHIWLAACREANEITLRVKDTGIGIPADLLPRIFDPFVQADQSLSRSQDGLGIGLALVKRLVELHGGRINAHSHGPNQGSEFVVRLPSVIGWPASKDMHAQETVSHARPSCQGHRILMVDDNTDAAEALAVLLRLQGHEVFVASDGLTALEVVADFQPDVVVSDIGMPGVDGYELARQLRAQPAMEGVLLVALTGWGQEMDRCRSRMAGFDHHLVKPVEVDALQQLLAKF